MDQPQLAPFSLGYVNILIAGIVAPLTIVCARLGVKLASRASQEKLVKVFDVEVISDFLCLYPVVDLDKGVIDEFV